MVCGTSRKRWPEMTQHPEQTSASRGNFCNYPLVANFPKSHAIMRGYRRKTIKRFWGRETQKPTPRGSRFFMSVNNNLQLTWSHPRIIHPIFHSWPKGRCHRRYNQSGPVLGTNYRELPDHWQPISCRQYKSVWFYYMISTFSKVSFPL